MQREAPNLSGGVQRMPFEKGDKNINRAGSPPLEERKDEPEHVQQIKASELRAAVGRLRRAMPRALQLLIDAMDNESIDMKDRLKYGKDVYDLYLKSVGLDMSLKKAKHAMKQGKEVKEEQEEEEKVQVPAVVFTLHKNGTNDK